MPCDQGPDTALSSRHLYCQDDNECSQRKEQSGHHEAPTVPTRQPTISMEAVLRHNKNRSACPEKRTCDNAIPFRAIPFRRLSFTFIPSAEEPGLIISMMAAIYATLLIAFVLDLLGRGRLAVSCLFLSFILCVWLFLWEIYSPEYGFRMPWLQVELGPIVAPVRGV